MVVVCTSARFAVRSQLASCVPFHAGQFGFTAYCVAQCENILSIDERQLDRAGAGRIGVLDGMAWRLACHDEVARSVAGRGRSCRSDQEPSLTIRSAVGAQPVTNG